MDARTRNETSLETLDEKGAPPPSGREAAVGPNTNVLLTAPTEESLNVPVVAGDRPGRNENLLAGPVRLELFYPVVQRLATQGFKKRERVVHDLTASLRTLRALIGDQPKAHRRRANLVRRNAPEVQQLLDHGTPPAVREAMLTALRMVATPNEEIFKTLQPILAQQLVAVAPLVEDYQHLRQEARRRQAAKENEARRQQQAQKDAERQRQAEQALAARQAQMNDLVAPITATHCPIETFMALQTTAHKRLYLDMFAATPTLADVRRRFGLTSEAFRQLQTDRRAHLERQAAQRQIERQRQAQEREQERAARQAQQAEARRQAAWHGALIHAADMPQYLGITPAEFKTWRENGRIPVSAKKPFYKWGRSLETTLHHPEALVHITPTVIAQWRADDLARMSKAGRRQRERTIAAATAGKTFVNDVMALVADLGCQVWPSTPTWSQAQQGPAQPYAAWLGQAESLVFLRPVTVEVPVAAIDVGYASEGPDNVDHPVDPSSIVVPSGQVGSAQEAVWTVNLRAELHVSRRKALENMGDLRECLTGRFSNEGDAQLAAEVQVRLQETIARHRDTFEQAVERREFMGRLREVVEKGLTSGDVMDPQAFNGFVREKLGSFFREREARRAAALLQLENYPAGFAPARSMARTLHFRMGATNSGKTHHAIERMMEAPSGVYLAPLRLLAMEVRDRLMAAGVPCNLLTGEEHDIIPGATHTACTVEMVDLETPVDVAVLDEIQMLEDGQRGWAWTAALVGTPAHHLYVCGAERMLPLCQRMVQYLGEPFTVERTERKTPLLLDTRMVDGVRDLQPGDALIAFSRADVLTLSARARRRGLEPATIYGALAPEVRRTEAERFASGRAQVVVSTDAIGMGLNLPIKRVVFSTVHKFDGTCTRTLNAAEVSQIAGRAGRYGLHVEGRVTAFKDVGLDHLRTHLEAPTHTSLKRLPVSATYWHVRHLSELLGTDQVATLLRFFASRITIRSDLLAADAMLGAVRLAAVVDFYAPRLSLKDRFTLACAPVDADQPEAVFFQDCLKALSEGRRKQLPTVPTWLEKRGLGHLEEAEALAKSVTIYAWLSFKFPGTFYQAHELPAMRRRLSQHIERELLRQAGFGQTGREKYLARQRDRGHRSGWGYGRYDEWYDDER